MTKEDRRRNKPVPDKFIDEARRVRLIRGEPRDVLVKAVGGKERLKILDRRKS